MGGVEIKTYSGPVPVSDNEKIEVYNNVINGLELQIDREGKYAMDSIGKMATVAQHLRNNMGPVWGFWVGFYRETSPMLLQVGPYQGTAGCLFIPFENGVCGASARLRRTLIVPDVNKFEAPDG